MEWYLYLPLILIVAFYKSATHLSQLFPLLGSSPTTTLTFSPNDLKGIQIVLVILLFLIRKIGQSIGLVYSPKFIEKPNEDTPGSTHTIVGPSQGLSLVMPLKITPNDLELYHLSLTPRPTTSDGSTPLFKPTSLTSSDPSPDPLHLQLFLAAITNPAISVLLAKRTCNITPLGSVNVRNKFELLLPPSEVGILVKENINGAGGKDSALKVVSKLRKGVVKVKRGWEISIIAEVFTSKEEVLFRQTFTLLQFTKHRVPVSVSTSIKPTQEETTDSNPTTITTTTTTTILPKDPLKWASLCKDYNPIHISTILAKGFGFPGRIGHGNHVVARGIDCLRSGQVGSDKSKELKSSESEKLGSSEKERTVEIEFKRPVVLPAKIEVVELAHGEGFDILSRGKVCIQVKY